MAPDDLADARDDILDALRDADEDLAAKLTAKDNPTGIVLTAPMIMAINDSDDPVVLMRHLADNPKVSKQIAEMSPKRMERRLLKIELQIEARTVAKKDAAKEAPAPKRASGAPDPIEPGSGRTQTHLTAAEAAKRGDFKSFEKIRNEEEEKSSQGRW